MKRQNRKGAGRRQPVTTDKSEMEAFSLASSSLDVEADMLDSTFYPRQATKPRQDRTAEKGYHHNMPNKQSSQQSTEPKKESYHQKQPARSSSDARSSAPWSWRRRQQQR